MQYLRLSAGDRVLAYLYCFVSDGHVHFYLSGIDYSTGRQFRPGMLAHWLAIGFPLALVMLPLAWILLTQVLFRHGIAELGGGRWLIEHAPTWHGDE